MKKSNIYIPNWEYNLYKYCLEKGSKTKGLPSKVTHEVKSITEIDKLNLTDNKVIGFIYKINFSDGTSYIGKKNLYCERNLKKGKRELAAMEDKRGSKKKKVIKESDWLTYFGSFKDKEFLNKILNQEVKINSREIIQFGFSKQHLTYLELFHQITNNVLEKPFEFRNDNILGKFYRNNLFINQQSIIFMSDKL